MPLQGLHKGWGEGRAVHMLRLHSHLCNKPYVTTQGFLFALYHPCSAGWGWSQRTGTRCLFWVPFFTASHGAHTIKYKGIQTKPKADVTEAFVALRGRDFGDQVSLGDCQLCGRV